MDVVDLARLQFAVTATLHFLFVAFTLGMVTVVAVLQTRALRTSDPAERAERMRRVRFWGGLYVINYALGIVSGLTQEFQFGMNWSGLSHVLGNVVGAPMAVETVVAFFLESTFLGLWAFGFGRVSARTHLLLIWGVALTAYASTFWIMVVNGFLQKPVGYAMHDGVARVTDWSALLTNGATWYALLHLTGVVALLAGVVMCAVSSYHLRHGRDLDFFRPALVHGSRLAGVGAVVTAGAGVVHLVTLEEYQPEKYAVVMGESGAGLERVQEAARAAYGPGDWLPPAWVGVASVLMLLLGLVLLVLVWLPAKAGRAEGASTGRFRLRLPMVLLPMTVVALVCGWLSREVGRQPWMVTGELTVRDAIGDVSAGGMLASLIAFTLVLGGLSVVNFSLIAHYARQGPDGGLLGDDDLFPESGPGDESRPGGDPAPDEAARVTSY
ncbi:cytochrome ubiquinol oxidase subunit I [Streptomyces globisporus]|uniref:cytochrome ubiquinol oxidase subunit I n=1 Tax=Streptomyces globisporus TaxID=1908 RepID=UPI0036F95C58